MSESIYGNRFWLLTLRIEVTDSSVHDLGGPSLVRRSNDYGTS